MKKLRFGIVALLTATLFSLLLCSCGSGPSGTVVDYGDAEAFEEALNRGENLDDKTLMFTVTELHPDSLLGFNVCGGEHLNFISNQNPDLKVGDTVGVKATDITNILGYWAIKYEKIDNPIIGENTIVSSAQKANVSENQEQVDKKEAPEDSSVVTEEETTAPEPTNTETETIEKEAEKEVETATEDNQEQTPLEIVDSNIVVFTNYSGSPAVSSYIAFKNNTDHCIGVNSPRMDYQDNDGKLIATDQFANCIPQVAKPGQVFYLYSYHFDIANVDTSNGLNYVADGETFEANNYYEIDISDVSFKTGDAMGVSIIGRGTNNTNINAYGEPGAVFYDSTNKVVGFCYGLEGFDAGQTKSFEIYGDMMSKDYDPSIVDHVEVFMQGNNY